jgi:hypothetical protein
MKNTTPFTYSIYCKPTNQYYYGTRYAVGCQPSDLWQTYFTSSKVVKSLINLYGKEAFDIKIRKIFKTKHQALLWEEKFLKRVQAAQSPKWLNKHNGNKTFYCTGHQGNLGRKQSDETKLKRRLANLGKKRPPFSAEHRQKIRDAKLGVKMSDEARMKMSQSRKNKPKSPEHKANLSFVKKIECPHCHRIGQFANMKRHHFDKCKLYSTTV